MDIWMDDEAAIPITIPIALHRYIPPVAIAISPLLTELVRAMNCSSQHCLRPKSCLARRCKSNTHRRAPGHACPKATRYDLQTL